MARLYADAAYYVALLVRQDRLHQPAIALSAHLARNFDHHLHGSPRQD